MKVLLIGVNGFIGHSLAARILETTNWDLYGIDLNDSHVRHHLPSQRFHFLKGDITKCRLWLDRHIAMADVVLPLAVCAKPYEYVRDPLATFELTFEEALRTVRACVKHGTRLVFPSTSEVYGMCPETPFDEETSPLVLGPVSKQRWIYSCSKQMLDRVIWAYGSRGLKFTIFRPFNWFGPNLDDVTASARGSSRVITQFLGHLFRRETVYLVDGGLQKRCFTYVDDGIDALMSILKNEQGRADGRIFNIGNPENHVTIRDLACCMVNVLSEFEGHSTLDGSLRIETISGKEYYGAGYQDVSDRLPDITAVGKALGWVPRVTLIEGIRRMVRHEYRRQISLVPDAAMPKDISILPLPSAHNHR